MSDQRHYDVERALIAFMAAEINETTADVGGMSKLLALNYFSAVPDPAMRTVTLREWRDMPEADADKAKIANYKRLERYLDGTTAIPAALVWPWINCLETYRDDCIAALGALGGYQFMEIEPGRDSKSFCKTMHHMADCMESWSRIMEDGVIDTSDVDDIRDFLADADKAQAALAGVRRHMERRLVALASNPPYITTAKPLGKGG